MLRKLYFTLDHLETKLHKALKALGGSALALAFIAIFVQVSYRYVISKLIILPLSFTEELSRYCMFWVIYLMLPVTIKDGLESVNTFLADRLHGVTKLLLFIVVRLICLFVAVMAFRYSFTVISTNWTYSSPSMHLPGVVMYSPVTISMCFVLMRYFIEFLGIVCKECEPFGSMGMGGAE